MAEHGGEQRGLHADNLDTGAKAARHRAHARNQPAAANRHDDGIQIGRIGKHFQRDGALPGGYQRIVERMDEGQTQLLFHCPGIFIRLVKGFAFQHHLAAHALGLHHLHRGGRARHHDGDRHAQPRAVIGKPLRMVARARRDHALGALFCRQVQQRVQRPAFLVGGGELLVLELQPDVRAGNGRQGLAVQGGCAHHGIANRIRSGADIGDVEAGFRRSRDCWHRAHGSRPIAELRASQTP